MVLLTKKRLFIILTCIALSIVSCMFFAESSKTEDFIETVALPVSNKVIVIDAGHGIPDEGC